MNIQKLPPFVTPHEMPNQIVARFIGVKGSPEYELMVGILQSYFKAGEFRRWDDYRRDVRNQAILESWKEVILACFKNGFAAPTVRQGVIHWQQIRTAGRQLGDRCSLCSDECQRREDLESGKTRWIKARNPNYQEPKPCWSKED